jgi:hypothetical protein
VDHLPYQAAHHRQGQQRAGRRQHRALEEALAGQLPGPGAQRTNDGVRAPPVEGAAEQDRARVRAADQQQEEGPHPHPEQRLLLRAVLEGSQVHLLDDGLPAGPLAIRPYQAADLGPDSKQRSAIRQASHPFARLVRVAPQGLFQRRQPQVGGALTVAGRRESIRHHADDARSNLSLEAHGLAQHVGGAGEEAGPHSLAYDHGPGAGAQVVARLESPSQDDVRAHGLQPAGREHGGVDLGRRIGLDHHARHARGAHRSQRRKARQIAQPARGDRAHGDQPIGRLGVVRPELSVEVETEKPRGHAHHQPQDQHEERTADRPGGQRTQREPQVQRHAPGPLAQAARPRRHRSVR